ncbi:hypothetical protein DUNSADRAFT_3992 [Dunaliella salina]|uniref:Encoded protein n=1 Tax=Dunaliella salina TaxID=3046 RepID=A0ABQ7GT03_DUNSA|nr:hypothetical protein DUNSADRAFT_3992 [Dunaliella salina]|eukprot:KAF5837737.1 hypothetical protein DUNSADRAFT_3992 [Dunaliella salina]
MIKIATSLNFQEQRQLGTRIFNMAYILLKDGERKGKDLLASDGRSLVEALRVELIDGLTIGCNDQETAEPYLHEQAAVCEAAAQEQGAAAPKAARTEFYHFPLRLGKCLTWQSKLLEAEEVLDRVLALSNKLASVHRL